jgi:hypothetical protein
LVEEPAAGLEWAELEEDLAEVWEEPRRAALRVVEAPVRQERQWEGGEAASARLPLVVAEPEVLAARVARAAAVLAVGSAHRPTPDVRGAFGAEPLVARAVNGATTQ